MNQHFGTYTIRALIGSGGMGEVYQAYDTTLRRDVALKVLPAAFASDPDRLARFKREAYALAALNHPHIGHIYGLEEVEGVQALVLELVDGYTLADRVAQGPLPRDEALRLAAQIADALAAAHAEGFVHRDLKPANIKVRSDGEVKILDFGLAKASAPASLDLSQSLTETGAGPTRFGVVLGTAAYMSPEQARGQAVDTRTDIWAFGCILYEMLTGRTAFARSTLSDTIAAVLEHDPEWHALPPDTPEAVRRLLRRCLERTLPRRLADIRDAHLDIEDARVAPPEASVRESRISHGERVAWLSALVLAIAVAGTAVTRLIQSRTAAKPSAVTRTTIPVSDLTAANGIALSPDGRQVVYVGAGGTQLFVRALDALEPVALATGSRINQPFVSPDGQWVGFFEGRILKKVPIAGGLPVTLAQIEGTGSRGATWASDDAIVVATSSIASGLWLVSASDGALTLLTQPDRARGEAQHLWPERLPDGHTVLFTITAQAGGPDAAQIAALDLNTRRHRVVLRGGDHAEYFTSGHLVYIAAGALRAVPFDPTRLEPHGTGALVVPRLLTTAAGASSFAVADDGTLVYLDAPQSTDADERRTLTWVDRSGKEEPLPAPPRGYIYPRLSPDGNRIALDVSTGSDRGVWIWDIGRAILTRLTLDSALNRVMEWTRDGRRLVYTSNRGGADNLWWQPADGSGRPEPLSTSPNVQLASGSTPDGSAMIFFERRPKTGQDLLLLALDGSHRLTRLLETPFNAMNGVVSNDGHWIAYESDRSGRSEIYVRPFPNTTDGEWQVSTEGGTRPAWSHDGAELYFVALARSAALMRVAVQTGGPSWRAGPPVKLFEGYAATNPSRTFDVAADGRFLMIKPAAPSGSGPSLIVVQHWDEEVKARVRER